LVRLYRRERRFFKLAELAGNWLGVFARHFVQMRDFIEPRFREVLRRESDDDERPAGPERFELIAPPLEIHEAEFE
jgi:hypothetical protein